MSSDKLSGIGDERDPDAVLDFADRRAFFGVMFNLSQKNINELLHSARNEQTYARSSSETVAASGWSLLL